MQGGVELMQTKLNSALDCQGYEQKIPLFCLNLLKPDFSLNPKMSLL